LAFLFSAFAMVNGGCDKEPILTEPILETEPSLNTVPNMDIISETMEVKIGETLTISLISNPTTGYSWQPEFDAEFLKLVDKEFVIGSSDLVGAPGIEKFEFLTLKQGETMVTMIYKRPWEEKSIEERITLVKITPANG